VYFEKNRCLIELCLETISEHPGLSLLPEGFRRLPGGMPRSIALDRQFSHFFRSFLIQMEIPSFPAVPGPDCTFEDNAITGIEEHLNQIPTQENGK
jgi:hypothetical protein